MSAFPTRSLAARTQTAGRGVDYFELLVVRVEMPADNFCFAFETDRCAGLGRTEDVCHEPTLGLQPRRRLDRVIRCAVGGLLAGCA